MHWLNLSSDDIGDDKPEHVERISILVRGAYGVGKTKLCRAFLRSIDELINSSEKDHNTNDDDDYDDESDYGATNGGGFYGVYTKTIPMNLLLPFSSSPKTVSLLTPENLHCGYSTERKWLPNMATIRLVDTTGFDTNIGSLPNSMIRDIDAVMLLFSCCSQDRSWRSCPIAYENLKKEPRLSSSVDITNPIRRNTNNSIHTNTGENDDNDSIVGDESEDEFENIRFTPTLKNKEKEKKKSTLRKLPVFMLIGTKGDLQLDHSDMIHPEERKELNIIREIWTKPDQFNQKEYMWRDQPDSYKKYKNELDLLRHHRLSLLESRIKRDKYKLMPTQFTSAIRPTKNSGVLKAFLSLIMKIIEMRLKHRGNFTRPTVSSSSNTSTTVIRSDLDLALSQTHPRTVNTSISRLKQNKNMSRDSLQDSSTPQNASPIIHLKYNDGTNQGNFTTNSEEKNDTSCC